VAEDVSVKLPLDSTGGRMVTCYHGGAFAASALTRAVWDTHWSSFRLTGRFVLRIASRPAFV
jgi:hypothetical protein